MTENTSAHTKRPFVAHTLRIFALPIIVFWVALTVIVNIFVPQLEVISEQHSVPLAPVDAPSMKAMYRVGSNFKEYKSNSTVMMVLEGQQPLGETAHHYYDAIVK
jgi:RND superfamily putative drug exporter